MNGKKSYQTLIFKEFKQNVLIYALPFLIALAVFIFGHQIHQFIAESLALKLAIAIPIAIALAYGVQSFDLEESGLTRDFLIVKPLSVSQIIRIKYLTGFLICFLNGLFWMYVLAPKIIDWPSPLDLKGFLFLAIILLELVVYSLSFLSGVMIKGPLKIIGAILGGFIAVLFIFSFWFELVKYISWNNIRGAWSYIILFTLTVLEMVLLYKFVLLLSRLNLQNQKITTQKRRIAFCLAKVFIFPLILFGINIINTPAIIPYSPLSLIIHGNREAFFAYQGAKCPVKNIFALADFSGKLGLAEYGKIPTIIYHSPLKQQYPLQNISWAPDGSKISFSDQKKIRVLSVSDKKIIFSFTGNYAMWSRDSQQLLIGTIIGNSQSNPSVRTSKQQTIQLSLADFKTNTVTNLGQLKTIGSAISWDSINQNILTIDQTWRLVLINLKKGSIKYCNIPKDSHEKSSIFLVKIIPPPQNKNSFSVQIYNTNQRHSFNIDLYDYNCSNNSIIHQSTLKNVKYTDFIAVSQEKIALYSTAIGIYRTIKLPKAVK